MSWIKCKDTDKPPKFKPCKFSALPDKLGALTSDDMAKLGYIKCEIDKKHYLMNAIRPCKSYEPIDE
jgi:hypothetical protein